MMVYVLLCTGGVRAIVYRWCTWYCVQVVYVLLCTGGVRAIVYRWCTC
jgi:hypothetical protein